MTFRAARGAAETLALAAAIEQPRRLAAGAHAGTDHARCIDIPVPHPRLRRDRLNALAGGEIDPLD